ncbi:Fermitin family-like protein [Vespula squamosa]|uniref:Fermitin family-like protein n=1 Tax=Vespula squamosa TaxID=30214 RepID=A0ABD2AB71_VESSQ
MYSDGHEVDGSWVLRVYVTDLQVERSLRVKGELHIGGVMLRLVEDLDFIDRFQSKGIVEALESLAWIDLTTLSKYYEEEG